MLKVLQPDSFSTKFVINFLFLNYSQEFFFFINFYLQIFRFNWEMNKKF